MTSVRFLMHLSTMELGNIIAIVVCELNRGGIDLSPDEHIDPLGTEV